MKPLLPTHAQTLLGPDPAGDWGGVPWDRAEAVPPGMYLPPEQQPFRSLLAHFAADKVVVVTANVDDDTDGPGGSTAVDPCWQGTTSLRWPDGASIDSRTFRGMVMHAIIEKRGGGLGDFGLCCWDGIIHCVQYYDIGPTRKTQEGAEKTLRDFGVIDSGQTSRHAAVVGNDVRDFCSLIFCGSAPKDARGRPYAVPEDEIIERTLALWKKFTGRGAAGGSGGMLAAAQAPAAASKAAPSAATRGTAAGSVGVAVPLALAMLLGLLPMLGGGCAAVRDSAYFPETVTVSGADGYDTGKGWDRQSVGLGFTWRLKTRTVIPLSPSPSPAPSNAAPR